MYSERWSDGVLEIEVGASPASISKMAREIDGSPALFSKMA